MLNNLEKWTLQLTWMKKNPIQMRNLLKNAEETKRKGLSEMKHPTTLLLIESSSYFPIPQFRAYSYSVPLIAE